MREIHVEEQVFSTLHPVIQKNLMHRVIALAAGSRKDITALHVEAVCDLFENQVGRHLSLPYGLAAYRDYDGIVLIREQNDKIPEKKQEACMTELVVPGETIWQDGTKIHTEIIPFSGFYQQIPQKKYTKWFDYDKIKSNVLVRTRCPGDYLQIGAFGGRKKLKNFFVDEKVPQRRRDEILLLADGPHILWVVGYRMSEAYKVTHETKRILCVCVDGGQNKDE
jgi:tRNA(Ile)-lysidine synthase